MLLDLLARELRDLGLTDVERDANGYLFATIEATPGVAAPTIGFLAHVDTSPEMSGAGVVPIVHRHWSGEDIALPDDRSVVLRASDWPELAAQVGTTSSRRRDYAARRGRQGRRGGNRRRGGAPDRHPEIPHGRIRIAFTPDEEIGRGPNHFDVERFGAVVRLHARRWRLAASWSSRASPRMRWPDVRRLQHASRVCKKRMVNAIRQRAVSSIGCPGPACPRRPPSGYEGFVHPYQMEASVDRTSVRC